MPVRHLGVNVFDEAIDRMVRIYEKGHRVVVSFSGGKDSGICVEVCLIAAAMTDKLPIDVVMRDEEIMFPGTFEYSERIAARDNINFHWLIANQPIVNVFNRESPYFWVFDPELAPEQWVRQPPEIAEVIPEKCIEGITNIQRFPTPVVDGKKEPLYVVLGLRTAESINRKRGLISSGGYTTKPNGGIVKVRPIYDWSNGDVWKAIGDNQWDYNSAYDVMVRLGVSRHHLRIAPPTLVAAATKDLAIAAKAWPKWFDKVSTRLPGVRTAAMYGRRAVEPIRKLGETWEQTFKRTCLHDAPEWIMTRAKALMDECLAKHTLHSTAPFQDNNDCSKCGMLGNWRRLCQTAYMGDPFCLRMLPSIGILEPEFFRNGAGKWGGRPTW